MAKYVEGDNTVSAIDAYVYRVYKIIVIMLPLFCLIASSSITILYFAGIYPGLNQYALLFFDCMDLSFLAIGIYLARTLLDKGQMARPGRISLGKIVMVAIIVIQWNAISYIFPFNDFWAFCGFFVSLEVFFFDNKVTFITSVLIAASTFISWFIYPERLLPSHNELFAVNMIYRVVDIALILFSINAITFFGRKYLVEELEKHANYDTLTHLLNRRSMDKHVQNALKKAQSGNSTFCILMMDIDDFKKVNDTYGHDCGDEVLKYVAYTIATGVKKNDIVIRWGGEEIIVIMDATLEQCSSAAERIRKDIEKDPVRYKGNVEVSVTVTIGIAPYSEGITIQQMIEDADAKLYYGKKHGKNQVVNTLEG